MRHILARRLAPSILAMGLLAVPAMLYAQSKPAAPATAKPYKAKLTPWGEPDLRGSWPVDFLNGVPLQRDPKYGARAFLTDAEYAESLKKQEGLQARYENDDKNGKIGRGHWDEAGDANRQTSLLVEPADGRLPAMTEEGKRRSALMRSSWARNQPFDAPTDFDTWDRCITRGLPASMLPMHYNNGIRVWQSPGIVAIELEMVHETRIIPTDGKSPPVPRQISNWMGESRGHWENGNTLVVETTNFKPGPSATNAGTVNSPPDNKTPVSESARYTERFTITGPDTVNYRATWNDPVVFTKPWTVSFDWRRNEKYGMFEYACHEGDVQIRNFITSSRAQRDGAQKTAAK